MIEGLKPYAEYKDSGLPWTGSVPAHWNVHQAGQIGRLLKGSGGSKADNVDEGLPCVRYGQLYTKYRGFIHAPKSFIRPSKAAQYTAIRYGDILFAASGEKVDEIGKSAVNLMRTAAFCGGDVIILRPRMDACPPFLGYALDSYASASQKATMCRGSTIKHIYPDELRLLAVSLPPLDEQAAIVRFLDHANRKIDGFIRAKRKLIGLLNEQKQAIIHRAVTRGLDPDVPLKPSGIPWLGDIPERWKRIRLKFEASHIVDCLHATPSYQADGVYPAIRTADIEPGRVRIEQAKRIAPGEFRKWTGRLKPQGGDILYSREGERFGIAANVPPETELCISQRMMIFRIRKPHNSEYVMWQLNCQHVYLQASLYVMGSTAPHVNVEQIKNFQLALPPVEEQNAIADHIRMECGIINNAIARTEREIALMQEYRTRLTADIVTGKLDVREAAARLPEVEAESGAEHPLEEIEPDDGLVDEE